MSNMKQLIESLTDGGDGETSQWWTAVLSSEPLDPELMPYLEDSHVFGQVLRHPLVYQVPFTKAGLANLALRNKMEALQQAAEEGNLHAVVWLHERPHRLPALMDLASALSHAEYWELLGQVWSDTENVFQMRDLWRAAFASDRPGSEMFMAEDEVEAFRHLPDVVTVHRGAQHGLNEDGMSWTLDRDKAAWFACRGQVGPPVVLSGTVDKRHVLAHLTRRGEAELVIPDPSNVRFEDSLQAVTL